MKHFSYFLLVILLSVGCAERFKKASDGTEYKIIRAKSGKKIMKGDHMELNSVVKYKDSILFSTYEDGMPQFAPYDTASFPPLFKEVFRDIHVGDSIILKVSTDTLIKKGQGGEFMRKGQFITQNYRVVNVFQTKEQADSAYNIHAKVAKGRAYDKTMSKIKKDITTTWAAQMKTDDEILKNYISQKGMTASKTSWGTYVTVTTPGSGDKLDANSIALVNYTGKTLVDSVFDSNVDPKFGHVEPFNVDLGQFNVVPGWIDALKMLRKGDKATIFIPSSLAYGTNGRQPSIKPNENLVFDIEVVDILTPDQNAAMLKNRQQEQIEKRKKMQEEAMKKMNKNKDSSIKK